MSLQCRRMPSVLAIADFLRPQSLELASTFIYGAMILFESFSGVDYVILALLVGCALRRNELAELDVATIQQREGRWVLADLEGKGRRIRTVAIPIWVKHGINGWMTAAGIEDARMLRSISKGGKVGESLSDWAVWSVVE